MTWTTGVEPMLQARCLGGHTTGGFWPMSLETYQEAPMWATAIRDEVLERRMPPWPAAPGVGDFINLSCGASTIDRDIEALAVTPRAPGSPIEIAARRVRCPAL